MYCAQHAPPTFEHRETRDLALHPMLHVTLDPPQPRQPGSETAVSAATATLNDWLCLPHHNRIRRAHVRATWPLARLLLDRLRAHERLVEQGQSVLSFAEVHNEIVVKRKRGREEEQPGPRSIRQCVG